MDLQSVVKPVPPIWFVEIGGFVGWYVGVVSLSP